MRIRNKERHSCNNCVCKDVCYERIRIEEIEGEGSEAIKEWEEFVEHYNCQYYRPKLPKDAIILPRDTYHKLKQESCLFNELIKKLAKTLNTGV